MGLFEVLITNMILICGENNIEINNLTQLDLTLIKMKLFAPNLNAFFGITVPEITPLIMGH